MNFKKENKTKLQFASYVDKSSLFTQKLKREYCEIHTYRENKSEVEELNVEAVVWILSSAVPSLLASPAYISFNSGVDRIHRIGELGREKFYIFSFTNLKLKFSIFQLK